MILLLRQQVFYCLSCAISYNISKFLSILPAFQAIFAFLKICFSSQRVIRLTKLLGATERHLKDNKVFKRQCNHQAEPTWAHEGKAIINLVSFYNKVTHSMDEGKVVDVVLQYFSKAFDTVSQSPSGQDVQWQDKEIQSVLNEKTVAAGLRGLQGMGLIWLAASH